MRKFITKILLSVCVLISVTVCSGTVFAGEAKAGTTVTKVEVKSPTKVKLYWSQAKDAAGYEVYRSYNQGGGYELLAQVKGSKHTTYTDKGILAGKTYYYKIRPRMEGDGDTGSGKCSAPVKVKTVASAEITGIVSVNSNTMRIHWNKVNGAASYDIYRSTSREGGFKKIGSVNKSVTKYTDTAIKSGKKYYYKIVTVGNLKGERITNEYSKPVSYRALSQVKLSSVKSTADNFVKVKWKKVAGATRYKIYRATSAKGKYKKIATVESNGEDSQFYIDRKAGSGKTYYYKVQAFSSDDGIIQAGKGDMSGYKATEGGGYAIMGKSTVTVDQMVKLFKSSGRPYPSIYKNKGAKDIKKFCKIVLNESNKEGVRAEVIFAQVCLETGFLSFGGQVKPEQCNFSGIGATDDGAAGATFPNVKTGIRAQVQHLKGYASKESLNQKCVDPRFKYLTSRRGTTPYVQQLGNGNWATDPMYASKLMTLIKKMKSY